MRWWLTILLAAPLAAAGGKLSPLLSEADSAFLVALRDDAAGRRAAVERGLAVLDHPDLLPGDILVAGQLDSALALADSDAVQYVFPAAPELLTGERVAACRGALVADGDAIPYTKFGQGWPALPGGGVDVGYVLLNTVERIPLERALEEVVRAAAEWSRHANLRFVRTTDPQNSRTVAIRFARGGHGDAYPFDGPGRILAHTFYPAPPNPEPLAGDMHLDADETWEIGTATDLFTVVLHEMGHAIGLGHSDRPGAVMYPYYRLAAGLSSDDIDGVRSLYGTRDPAVQPPAGPLPLRLTITAPAAPATTQEPTVTLRGNTEGGKPPVQVRWQSNRGPAGPAVGSSEWRADAVPLSTGVNRIDVTALDAEGITASQAAIVTRTETAKPPAPQPLTLKITYPGLSIIGVSAASITIRGQASGAERVAWSTSTGFSGDASGAVVWSAEVPLYIGTNTVTVRAFNAAGAQVWRSLTVVRR